MFPMEEVQKLLASKKSVNHILHAILTAITFGLWGIVWLCCFAFVSQHNGQIDDKVRIIEMAQLSQQASK
ncbi:hypothetical protein [Candidatus Spongiihabitans sp.]|uniref:hypothetical protein n=1 Tax=Candidatus Spongiihabitans sp. TaxID=3101308 RepID=UPI003C6FEC2F